MDLVPLIPKGKCFVNQDVSHIIREIFQDLVKLPEFPNYVVENTQRFNLENHHLKASGARVASFYNKMKLCMEDFGVAENAVMAGLGTFMQHKNSLEKDETAVEYCLLKRKELSLDVNESEARRFGLLQKIDLLPSRAERSIDFRINSNQEHLCSPPCPNIQDELDLYPSKLDLKSRKRVCDVHGINKLQRQDIIFRAEPDTVLFEDYEIDTIYESAFKLRNVSKKTQTFLPRFLPKTSFFRVELRSGSTRVAPGMCATFSVKYCTNIYRDLLETVCFQTYSGHVVEVILKSYRKAPKLTVFVYRSLKHFTDTFVTMKQVEFCDRGRALALNSTIDCGSCLLGRGLNIKLILKNEGSIGRFFIIDEQDWHFADVTAVNKQLELVAGTFHIYPAYFELAANDFAELNVSFYPSEYGIQVEKLFMLCDNSTFEELEVIGDGVLFEVNSVTLRAQRKYDNMMDMDASSRYVLNFRKMVPYEKRKLVITVNNNCIVDFDYKWVVRESICHIQGTRLMNMHPDWVVMEKNFGDLPSYSSTDFYVTLESKTAVAGLYSLVFTLYILDIPQACLSEDHVFFVTEEAQTTSNNRDDTKVVNVIVDEVEIVTEVVPINIQVDPEVITIPYLMNYHEKFKQKVQIYSDGGSILRCTWKDFNSDLIDVYPVQFFLEPKTVFVCNVDIHVWIYRDIHETLSLVVNEGLHKTTITVSAKVTKPIVQFSENTLNFGYIPRGKKPDTKKLYVQNVGQEMVAWKIFELYYDHESNQICEIDATRHLSVTSGELDENDSCEIVYNIDNFGQYHRWLSFLVLLSSHPLLEAMGSLCLITYEITRPEIVIHTGSSQQPILFLGKLLYVGCSSFHSVCLHNISTKLAASFVWGSRPVGVHANKLEIQCSPRSGVVQPQKCTHVTISLLPLESGIFDEIYMPCFVGNVDEPLMLTVLCVVDDISVYFHLPHNDDRYEKVFWPAKVTSRLDQGCVFEQSKTNLEKGPIVSEIQAHISEASQQTMSTSELVKNKMEEAAEEERFGVNNKGFDLMNYETACCETHTSLLLDTFIDFGKEESDLKLSSTPTEPLRDCFGSDLVLHDHVIEYRHVPLRTPIRKTIIIENVTPLRANYVVDATNFPTSADTQHSAMDGILVKLKMKNRDEWKESVNNKYGVVVKCEPNKGTVNAHALEEVDIWVYANTWGTYVEEMTIELNNLPLFCFNVLIQVVGIPIEYPIAINAIDTKPILRFGNIPYATKQYQRKLKVTNYSSIPVCLVWHVFIPKNAFSPSKSTLHEPFNIIIDTFSTLDSSCISADDKTTLELIITKEYLGKEDYNIFQVEPREIVIDPKLTKTITLTFNADFCKPKFTKTHVVSYLVGLLHIAEEFTFQSNLYIRSSGVNLPPTKVKLEAVLELPLLHLEFVKGDKRIRAYANDIIDAQEVRYNMMLVFRNGNAAPAAVYFHAASPFRVVTVRTAQVNPNDKPTAVLIQPGECIEVSIECIIDAESVLHFSNMLYNEKSTVFSEIPNFKNNSITVARFLNVHQHGLKKQAIPLELVIFYPKLSVSHNLIDFGVVFVGDTKKMLLTLVNPTGAHLPFSVRKTSVSNVIIIRPETGVIPKASGTTPSKVILSLYFTPTESKLYQEAIRVSSNIPFHYFTVELTGTGSHNEQFYVEGK